MRVPWKPHSRTHTRSMCVQRPLSLWTRARMPQRRASRPAVDGVASGWLSPGMLLTHPLPLHELSRGFELMEERPDGFIKAYIDFDL